jgi:putative protease
MSEQVVGKVTHFFGNISVAVVELSEDVKLGDKLHFQGASDDFTQDLESMQIDHKPVETAKAGDSIGLKTKGKAHEGTVVYKFTD